MGGFHKRRTRAAACALPFLFPPFPACPGPHERKKSRKGLDCGLLLFPFFSTGKLGKGHPHCPGCAGGFVSRAGCAEARMCIPTPSPSLILLNIDEQRASLGRYSGPRWKGKRLPQSRSKRWVGPIDKANARPSLWHGVLWFCTCVIPHRKVMWLRNASMDCRVLCLDQVELSAGLRIRNPKSMCFTFSHDALQDDKTLLQCVIAIGAVGV